MVVKLINERQTNEFFFRDLQKVLGATRDIFRDPQLEELAIELLQAVNLETGWSFEPHSLLSGCRWACFGAPLKAWSSSELCWFIDKQGENRRLHSFLFVTGF